MFTVHYPQGAGGAWLTQLIRCCVYNTDWTTENFNFHHSIDKPGPISRSHDLGNDDSCIAIYDTDATYTLWRLFVGKHVLIERGLKHYTWPNARLFNKTVKIWPHAVTNEQWSDREMFFWQINQSRWVNNFSHAGSFQIKWRDLFINPSRVWNTVNEFLDYHKRTNFKTYDFFQTARQNYLKNTLKYNTGTVNFKHYFFSIWALGVLQDHEYSAPFDTFEQFRTPIMYDWFHEHGNFLTDYCRQKIYNFHQDQVKY